MRFASLALALLLSLAACGDDDGDDPTPDAGTPDMPVVEDDAFVPTEPGPGSAGCGGSRPEQCGRTGWLES